MKIPKDLSERKVGKEREIALSKLQEQNALQPC
jgi:hypothetical protein